MIIDAFFLAVVGISISAFYGLKMVEIQELDTLFKARLIMSIVKLTNHLVLRHKFMLMLVEHHQWVRELRIALLLIGTLVSPVNVLITFLFTTSLVMMLITSMRILLLLLLLVKILIGLMVLNHLELWLLMRPVLIVVSTVELIWTSVLIGASMLLLLVLILIKPAGISLIRDILIIMVLMKWHLMENFYFLKII